MILIQNGQVDCLYYRYTYAKYNAIKYYHDKHLYKILTTYEYFIRIFPIRYIFRSVNV